MDIFNFGVCEKLVFGVCVNKVFIDEYGKLMNVKFSVFIKMVWQYVGNLLVGQIGNNNCLVEILCDDFKCEFIVVCDIQYMILVCYVDYVLFGIFIVEEEDIYLGENGGLMVYGIVLFQVIKFLYECCNIFDICVGLVKCLGIEKEFIGGLICS